MGQYSRRNQSEVSRLQVMLIMLQHNHFYSVIYVQTITAGPLFSVYPTLYENVWAVCGFECGYCFNNTTNSTKQQGNIDSISHSEEKNSKSLQLSEITEGELTAS